MDKHAPKDEAPEVTASKAPKESTTDSGRKHNKPPRKIHRTLAGLSRRSFNRFEAARLLSDHCLHSTVAEIQRDFGITVTRKFETVPGYMGMPTRCCRYWLTDDQKSKALKFLEVVI